MDFDQRPWGNYKILLTERDCQVKRIEILPHARFSLQKHARRAERWIVIAGSGVATVGKKKRPVSPGSYIEVPRGEVHRMENTGEKPLVFIEVQNGDYLGEDDIVRLEDDFHRT